MGPLISLMLQKYDSLSQLCEKTQTNMKNLNGSQENDDSVDDDNDHGEEWMKNPPLYSNV